MSLGLPDLPDTPGQQHIWGGDYLRPTSLALELLFKFPFIPAVERVSSTEVGKNCSVRLPTSAPSVRTGIQLQNKGKHHRGNPLDSSLTLTWHSYTHPVHRQRLSLLAAAPPLNDTVPGGRLHAQRSQSLRRNFCLPCALTEMPRLAAAGRRCEPLGAES